MLNSASCDGRIERHKSFSSLSVQIDQVHIPVKIFRLQIADLADPRARIDHQRQSRPIAQAPDHLFIETVPEDVHLLLARNELTTDRFADPRKAFVERLHLRLSAAKVQFDPTEESL